LKAREAIKVGKWVRACPAVFDDDEEDPAGFVSFTEDREAIIAAAEAPHRQHADIADRDARHHCTYRRVGGDPQADPPK
jgi:hypothetical protein